MNLKSTFKKQIGVWKILGNIFKIMKNASNVEKLFVIFFEKKNWEMILLKTLSKNMFWLKIL